MRDQTQYIKDNKLLPVTGSDILERARFIINEESKFCRGNLAVNRYGEKVSPMSPAATQWDIYGAIIKAAYNSNRMDIVDEIVSFVESLDFGKYSSLLDLNDYGTYSDLSRELNRMETEYKLSQKRNKK